MENVLYINKPQGISSFDVCFKLRKVLNTKKIGHTGTLDPNATGVMIVLFDKATKVNQFLTTDKKTYKTRVLYGIETDTLDIDGNIIRQESYKKIDTNELIQCLDSFLGESKQVVPITSAISVNGKRLYKYQLEGKNVELPIRDINVYSIKLNEIYDDGFSFTCEVSSGTYIRALVRDILNKLNTIGTVKELQRIKVDDIDIGECDELDDVLNGKYRTHNILQLLSKRYKTIEYKNIDDIKNGKRIKLDCNDEKVLIIDNNQAIAIYGYDATRNDYYSIRGLW